MTSASCDLAQVMVISLSVDQWSADSDPLPICKWPVDSSVTHTAMIIDTLTLSYATKMMSEEPGLVSMLAVPYLVITYSK
jgi:hypothetical protein